MSKEKGKKKKDGKDPATIEQERRDKQYYYVQDIISGINGNCHEVKKWSVTSASIVAVVGQVGISDIGWVAAIIGLLASAFWVTETIWRMNQWAFIRSLRGREGDAGAPAPQISTGWSDAYYGGTSPEASPTWPEKSWKGFWARFFQWETSLPHLLIVLFALTAVAIVRLGYIHPPVDSVDRITIEGPVHLDLPKN